VQRTTTGEITAPPAPPIVVSTPVPFATSFTESSVPPPKTVMDA